MNIRHMFEISKLIDKHYELILDTQEYTCSASFNVTSPFDQKIIATVADAGRQDAELAVTAAHKAFRSWRQKSPQDRSRMIRAWGERILEHLDSLSELLCLEQGKVLTEAKGEIEHAARLTLWAAEDVLRVHGMALSSDHEVKNFVVKQAVGPVAAITPWNFPAAAVQVKCASALAAGCSVILKPSEETPLIALCLAQLGIESGLPSGVLQVLTCKDPREVGEVLCSDPRVAMMSFTGSSAVGKRLASRCAGTMKRMAMELGGNGPFIVLADADLERAVEGAIGARFFNSGQICVGANRFFIAEEIYDDFADLLVERLKTLKVGNGMTEGVNMGPLINTAAVRKIDRLIADATSRGASIAWGAKLVEPGSLLYEPTVLTHVTDDMDISQEEIFGPVAALYAIKSPEDALERANNTRAGLAGYIYTKDQKTLWSLSEGLECGMVGANTTRIFSYDLPFGGIKESGTGREGGIHSLEEFFHMKNISLGL